MKTYNISHSYKLTLPQSERTRTVAETFAIAEIVSSRKMVVENMPIHISPGTISYIVGPSGSGKTTILHSLKDKLRQDNFNVADLDNLAIDTTMPLVDCLGHLSLEVAMKLLSSVGLSEASLMIDSYQHLSTGQQYRYRLVHALSTKPDVIIADEFCNCLDEITAAIISCNIRHIIDKSKLCFIAAGVSESCIEFLQPETIIHKCNGSGFSIDTKSRCGND